jgi:hypothetical protein
MGATEGVILEITTVANRKKYFIGDHAMGPEVLIGCRDIPIKLEKRISDLFNVIMELDS